MRTTTTDILTRYGVTLMTDPHTAEPVARAAIPRAQAQACVRDLEAIGVEASEAPDHDDPTMAWLYVAAPAATGRDR